jgi:[acyl-carrier-protein] S-malonyltransferase
MSLGLLFPGQGSQYIGMGQGLATEHISAKRVFQEADDLMDFKLSELMWNGSESELQLTKYAQPAILVHSVATVRVMQELFDCSFENCKMCAGHSLGEFSAHVAAETFSFSEAIRTVQLRADLMHDACLQQEGAMAAIIGLDDVEIVSICKSTSSAQNRCAPANFNSPGQTVISGNVESVQAAMALALRSGAKRAVELQVSGAFHSHLMESATETFTEWMSGISFSHSKFPIVSNVTGTVPEASVGVGDLLVRQLTSPVLWAPSIRYMVEKGINTFLELGPGSVLRGLNRRIARDTVCKSLGDPEDIESIEGFLQNL